MKLYYSPGACSLADHIALHEAGLDFDHVKVDLKAKTTENSDDFTAINPKGYVPALALEAGEVLTENVAILEWIAQQAPRLGVAGPMGRTHLLEALAYISTEVHKGFKPFFTPDATEDAKAKAGETITKRLQYLADRFDGDYLFGGTVSVADCYLFVMLLWAGRNGVTVPDPLPAFRDRMLARGAVQTALKHEGLA
ncbi:MAG: glutathione S-transferase N-terminal domain-containing protein [Pseudomonadota bacterium]